MTPPRRNTGFMGKIMVVDLTVKTIETQTVSQQIYRSFLSGMGLAAHVLYHNIPKGADPLGPDNMLGFVSGLLTGTGSFFTGRWMVTGKSPLTSGWGEANCGGHFSPAIKRCGVDGIFVTGISDQPVYLYVDDTTALLKDAGLLWGMDTVETETQLLKRYPGARVACIGPAGERRSLMAGVSTDKGRMAARSGLGAVMGAKGLKALVLAGNKRIGVHNKEAMKRISRICSKWVQLQPPFLPGFLTAPVGALLRTMPWVFTQDGLLYKILLRKWGTVSMNQISVEMGDAPIKNWKGSSRDWGFFKNLSANPDKFTKKQLRKFHCYSCPLGCGGICTTTGRYPFTHKPEYETVLSFGGFVLNRDVNTIFDINETLNRAGMDTISAGHVVAFAMECFEKKIITLQDTAGMALKWGSPEAISWLVDQIIHRQGIGHILADGVAKAAGRLGQESHAFAAHAGGQELAMHDSRNDPGFALHYSAEPAPGRHTSGAWLYYEMYQLWKKVAAAPRIPLVYNKARKYETTSIQAHMAKANSQFMNVMNGAGVCLFGGFLGARRIRIFDWLNAATGWHMTPDDYMAAGTRIQTLKQAFNLKHGIQPKNCIVKGRPLGHPPQARGANKGRSVDIKALTRAYWEAFGWDTETGKPTDRQIDAVTTVL
ncbi:MAG: aldehyde ferredoxin oxidoreductase family protein [Desulfotignum sp.]|nr:aldehyde ferredoxin oxidoreductase family protein [Desulfotignum sp.]